MLKMGLLGGGAMLLGPRRFLSRAAADNADFFTSPATRPFIKRLPLPPVTQESAFTPDPGRPDCQALLGENPRFFQLVEEERLVELHPDLPPTPIWGYRDVNRALSADPRQEFVVGPTFKVKAGQQRRPVLFRVQNNLPSNHVGFGRPITTVHLHGAHPDFRSDGWNSDIQVDSDCFQGLFQPTFGPGGHYDYCQPLKDPGFSFGAPDPGERPSTLWYHDHFLDFTGPNVYHGLAGFFLVFDELDANDETGTLFPETNLRLPSGEFDIPLAVNDKLLAPDGTLIFDTFDHNGFLGDKFLVNGAIQPFLEVKRRKYRFRFLNASNARQWQIFLTTASGQTFPMTQIGADSALFSQSIPNTESFLIAPAQRFEVVVDFADPDLRNVTELFFENRLEQTNGRKPDELTVRIPFLKLILQEAVPDPSRVPAVLRPFDAISPAELATAQRQMFRFERGNGAWQINGLFMDPNRPIVRVPENTPQIWRLFNKSGGWSHPIHIHHEFMRILSRNGQLPPLAERDGISKRDTALVGPNDDLEIFIKFRDFCGPFPFHCHNLEHEDMAMMARFDVARATTRLE
jgi:FtsP/CotA-like multicopper oxidase with cupredoxin domain